MCGGAEQQYIPLYKLAALYMSVDKHCVVRLELCSLCHPPECGGVRLALLYRGRHAGIPHTFWSL